VARRRAMTDEERKELYCKLCDEAHSNIEAPIMGRFYTPQCKRCKHGKLVDKPDNPFEILECTFYDWETVDKMLRGKEITCPHYEKK
jgi:uncharacterized paraquat-inducible protein A